jgi:3-hydroxybutyryl-CoA dehydrogenase
VNTIGVIGAGVMGTGLTQDLVRHGREVVLVDRDEQVLERARETVERFGVLGRLSGVEIGPDYAEHAARVRYTTSLSDLKTAEFVVENITENWALKKEIYPVIDEVCDERTVFAANTSVISITRFGNLTRRPDRVLGIHFMNPVPFKPTVEVIRGWHTSEQTLEIAARFLDSFGKRGIVVRDSPGFVSNRVLMGTVNEAVYLVQEGVASAADVDELFRSCFGHTMGPLETADLIGLDTILYSIEGLYEGFNDAKYRPCPLLKRMVDAGLHGRKSGQGFYSYR